VLIEDTLNLI